MKATTNTRVQIPLDDHAHAGELMVPPEAQGVVLFAHGSGSSRLSPRNTFVARSLNGRRIATLLFDLLTEAEDTDYARRFDIALLTRRLVAVADWVAKQAALRALGVGCFGASTGAAAALEAAALRPRQVRAVVSRGGRPDLADALLPQVRAPTLLIVGGEDHEVILLNRQAYARLSCVKALEIVPGATHLFEEPGALEQVAELAGDWFARHLAADTA
jgi:pimeloyl-ACP methyl ester carboxylesterase